MAQAELKAERYNTMPGPESKAEELYQMGLKFSTGMGVETDFVLAHKWFNLAALRGCEDAKQSRKELSEYMSSEEISKAQKAAREWLKLAH